MLLSERIKIFSYN